MEGFMVDLKTFFGLGYAYPILPRSPQSKYYTGFGVIFCGKKIPNLHDPYVHYYCTVWWFKTFYCKILSIMQINSFVLGVTMYEIFKSSHGNVTTKEVTKLDTVK